MPGQSRRLRRSHPPRHSRSHIGRPRTRINSTTPSATPVKSNLRTVFQFLVGFAYTVAYRFTGWEPFLLAAALIFGFGLFVLLPIFKLDGYWLLADPLGVVNLYRQVPRVAAHLLTRSRGRASAPLPWPGWVSTAVLVYGVLSALFLVFFGARLVMIFAAVAETYPARMAGLMRDLTQPPYRPASGRMHTVIGPTYVMLGVSFALARLAMTEVRAIKRVKR